jgi:hypothetical protein
MIIGNTVRITHTYMSWAGVPVDVETPAVKVYAGKVHGEPLATIVPEKIETGKYQIDYTVPAGIYDLIFEFSGTAEGLPEVTRISMPRSYI